MCDATRCQKQLKALPPMDDFMIMEIASDEEAGQAFCRLLAKRVLHMNVRNIHITPQKVLSPGFPGMHAIRMDIHIDKIEAENTDQVDIRVFQSQDIPDIIDVEPDTRENDKKELPRRSRYYQALLDIKSLRGGRPYKELPNTVIIWITTFDPFDRNRMQYTIKNGCVEDNEVRYNDGAVKIFLYTKGTEGNPNIELKNLLHYMESGELSGASDKGLEDLDTHIQDLKNRPEVNVQYMDLWLRELRMREDATREGMAQGIAQGMAAGNAKHLIMQTCKKIRRGLSVVATAEMLEEEETLIQKIYDVALKYAPEYDIDKIYEEMYPAQHIEGQ